MSMPIPKLLFFFIIFIFIFSTEAIIVHDIPRSELKRRVFNYSTVVPTTPPPFEPKLDWVQLEFLNAHNDLRKTIGTPPLQWDANLTAFAYSWANERKQDCDYRHHSTSPYGENMFWELYRETSATGVVLKWFSEKQFFNHTTNLCLCQPERDGCECGHYLNVIWQSTKKLGCSGFVYCNDQKGVLVVCSYDPIGNAVGIDPLNPGIY